METTEIFHCQICGREIKAGRGTIAKHGYKVVYGSFSKSCAGAGYAPIEVSCERLEEYIETVKIWVTNWTNELTALLENPPAVLTITVTRSGWTGPEERTYEKSDDFNLDYLRVYRVNSYGGAFRIKKSQLEQNIRYATKDIEEMEARAAGWHKEHDAPALEVAPVQEDVTSQPAPVQVEETGAALEEEKESVLTGYAEMAAAALAGSDTARRDLDVANMALYMELQEKKARALEDENIVDSTLEASQPEARAAGIVTDISGNEFVLLHLFDRL